MVALAAAIPLQVVQEVDRLVPKYPPPGTLAARNTEYPFQSDAVTWTCPSENSAFKKGDAKRFSGDARKTLENTTRMVAILEVLNRL